MTENIIARDELVFSMSPVRGLYMVDHKTIDLLSPRIGTTTVSIRGIIRGLETDYKNYTKVKRAMSDLLLNNEFEVKAYKSGFYNQYIVDLYEDGDYVNDKLISICQSITNKGFEED
jgi:hypothetical protein